MRAICGNVFPAAPEIAIHRSAQGPVLGKKKKKERTPFSMQQHWGHPACCGDRAYTASGSGFAFLQAQAEGRMDELVDPDPDLE